MISERLKELREEKGISQRQLASYLKISKTSVSNYETNMRVPDMDVAIRMAEYFEVSLDYLAGKTDIRKQGDVLQNLGIKGILAEKLKMLRNEKNISQELLAKELGVTVSTLSNYEKGYHIPNAVYIIKYAKYFDVSSDYLLSIREEDKENDVNDEASAMGYLHGLLHISSIPIKQKDFMYDLLACVVALRTSFPINEEILLDMLQSICSVVFRLSQDADYIKYNLDEPAEYLNNLVIVDMDKDVIMDYIKRIICVDNKYAIDLQESVNHYRNIRVNTSKSILKELIKISKEKYGNKFDDIFSQIDIEHIYNSK